MIRSIRNEGLRKFHASGDASKLSVQNNKRITMMLDALEAATQAEDMNLPGFGFHGLHGAPKRYAVSAIGNWRITFGWEDGEAIDVDLEDYH